MKERIRELNYLNLFKDFAIWTAREAGSESEASPMSSTKGETRMPTRSKPISFPTDSTTSSRKRQRFSTEPP